MSTETKPLIAIELLEQLDRTPGKSKPEPVEEEVVDVPEEVVERMEEVKSSQPPKEDEYTEEVIDFTDVGIQRTMKSDAASEVADDATPPFTLVDETKEEIPPSPKSDEGSSPDPLTDEQIAKRNKNREFFAKWMLDAYNMLQEFGGVALYDKLNTPEKLIQIKEFVMAKENPTETEMKAMMEAQKGIDKFIERRNAHQAMCRFNDEMKERIIQFGCDFMEVKGYDPNPTDMLIGVLVTNPILCAASAFKDKVLHSKF